VDPFHQQLARIGLDTAARYGFVLAGGYAVQAHGFLTRRSEDVDLFTSADAQASFSDAAADVIRAYQASGFSVAVMLQAEGFARLQVSDDQGRTAKEEPGIVVTGDASVAGPYRGRRRLVVECAPHPSLLGRSKVSPSAHFQPLPSEDLASLMALAVGEAHRMATRPRGPVDQHAQVVAWSGLILPGIPAVRRLGGGRHHRQSRRRRKRCRICGVRCRT
jgi:hypothetical protein